MELAYGSWLDVGCDEGFGVCGGSGEGFFLVPGSWLLWSELPLP